jgi:hypothetical protein
MLHSCEFHVISEYHLLIDTNLTSLCSSNTFAGEQRTIFMITLLLMLTMDHPCPLERITPPLDTALLLSLEVMTEVVLHLLEPTLDSQSRTIVPLPPRE